MSRLLFCLIAAGTIALGASAPAEVPTLINYQGVVTDAEGLPLSGPHDLTFRIYPDSASATPDLWSEEHLGVELTDGLFHVILGSVINLPDDLFGSAERWLGVQVGDDPEMTPRMRLTSVPYALRAAVADSALVGVAVADADWVITGRDMYAAVPGSVGVGTSDPLAKLHVMRVDRDVPLEALLQEDLLVEDSDAFLGLYSSTGGGFGSGISFGEISDGALTNKWTIVRTTGENGTLRFKFGTDPNYSNNSTIVKMAGGATATAQLDVAGTLEADGFRMPTGAVSGHVLKSDASGVGTWQSVGSVITDDDWVIDGDNMYSGVPGTVGIGALSSRGKLNVGVTAGTAAYISNSAPTPNNTVELGTEDHAVEGYGAVPFYAEGDSAALYAEHSVNRVRATLATQNVAVLGRNDNGSGTEGYLGGDLYGVYAEGDSAGLYAKHSVSRARAILATQDIAVLGKNDNGSGTEGYLGGDVYGVYGYSPDSCGVAGVSSTSHGVYGKSEGYAGVWGEALIGIGVRGYHIGNGNEGSLAGPSYGVYGQSMSDDPGVWGFSSHGEGVHGQSVDGYGVRAHAAAGYGVYSTVNYPTSTGVYSKNNGNEREAWLAGESYAVYGKSPNSGNEREAWLAGENHAVYGRSPSTNTYGFIGGADEGVYGWGPGAGVSGFSVSGHGVEGKSQNDIGVFGQNATTSTNYGYLGSPLYGVYGHSSNSSSTWAGYFDGGLAVKKVTSDDIAILSVRNSDDAELFEVRGSGFATMNLKNDSGGTAVQLSGNSSMPNYIMGRLAIGIQSTGASALTVVGGAKIVGNVMVHSDDTGDLILELGEGLDYAEGFDVTDREGIEPATVLCIDPDNPGHLTVSCRAYDARVAGIVAGGRGLGSGVRLGVDQFDCDVALAGRVYCKVDASEAAIEPGDLLTTSARPGHAMKATDATRASGATLGKAMEPLARGRTGEILVLVTLQ
ncbi:MAG: hypothetical protein KAY32_15200 [Candidatus Eisenbacteria sp.]|nr:hypothetical protein [Candidatus Eisenbacteria bacterium]